MTSSRKFAWLWLLLPFAWLSLMVYFFLTEASDLPDTDWFFAIPHADKVGHFGLFAIFTATLLFSFLRLPALARNRKLTLQLVLGICLVWAVGSELMQWQLTQTRSGDFADALVDILGAVCACIFYFKLSPRVPLGFSKILLPETDTQS